LASVRWLSNALESATADQDDDCIDCIVDQRDPETKGVEADQRSLVCPQPGRGAALQDVMRARCTAPDDAPIWQCDLGSAGPLPSVDVTCDGVDDDCDGTDDEDDEDAESTPTTCGIGACEAVGTRKCQGGEALDDCTPGTPASDDATCDDNDDNCDGEADEDFVGSSHCGTGACLNTGTQVCKDGVGTPFKSARS